MDMHAVIEFALGLLSIILGFFLNALRDSGNDLRKEIAEAKTAHTTLELEVAKQYVRREHYDEFQRDIFKSLDEIKELLHTKANRKDD